MDQALGLPTTALVADLGGTNARFAIAELATLALSRVMQFPCTSHRGPDAAIRSYLDQVGARPTHACLAVAAPVTGDEIVFTNSPWSFTTSTLCRDLGFEKILVLNDFQAFALALPDLAPQELCQIGGLAPQERGTKVAIGLSTGTGVRPWFGFFRMDRDPSEGGHIAFACQTAEDFALTERLRADRIHLSVERVLSGSALPDLYRAVAASHRSSPEMLVPDEVLTRALAGTDAIAVETLGLFIRWFGSFAADAALMFGARGGVYLGGGIAPEFLSSFGPVRFARHSRQKGGCETILPDFDLRRAC